MESMYFSDSFSDYNVGGGGVEVQCVSIFSTTGFVETMIMSTNQCLVFKVGALPMQTQQNSKPPTKYGS